jgi:TolA-binding protein
MRAPRPIEPEIRALIARGREVRSRQRALAWAGGATGLAAAAAFALVWFGPLGTKIQFTIGQGHDAGLENRWIGAETATPVPLNFSDGTAIELLPGTRARVSALNRMGANLNLETGHLRANVVHKRFADWTIGAGPYTVHVIGTEFDVEWNPDSEELEVDVHRGLVKVAGPSLTDDQSVSAKQRLKVALRNRHASLSPIDADDEARADLPQSEPVAEAPSEADDSAAGPRDRSPDPALSQWLVLAKRGDYQRALELVQRAGFDNVMQSCGPDDLLRLADVARVGGQWSRNVEILHYARKRYPRSAAASTASYSLGIAAFEHSAAYRESARWFDVYLRERPSGPLAAEALGRLMESYDRLGRREKAEATARRYLNAYPNGAHRDVALRLTSR